MDLQEKYDELDNIVSTLNLLIDELTDSDYIEDLRQIKYRAEDELKEIEPKLQEEYDKECQRQLNEYIKSVL